MSTRTVSLIDLEDPTHPESILLEVSGQDRMFTSLEKTAAARGATYTCICTTYEVMSIDECKIGFPVLNWRHDYEGGKMRDLEVTVVQTEVGGMPIIT